MISQIKMKLISIKVPPCELIMLIYIFLIFSLLLHTLGTSKHVFLKRSMSLYFMHIIGCNFQFFIVEWIIFNQDPTFDFIYFGNYLWIYQFRHRLNLLRYIIVDQIHVILNHRVKFQRFVMITLCDRRTSCRLLFFFFLH